MSSLMYMSAYLLSNGHFYLFEIFWNENMEKITRLPVHVSTSQQQWAPNLNCKAKIEGQLIPFQSN